MEEYGAAIALDGGIAKLMQLGQYREIDEVWGQLVAALEGEVSE
jgi:hypothetical protein